MHTISESVSTRAEGNAKTARLALVVGALGVVFGDIGTSPIYTVQTLFNPDDPHPVPIGTQNVYGLASLIFWSVMIIVTLTYVALVMRADNNGEGGIMALSPTYALEFVVGHFHIAFFAPAAVVPAFTGAEALVTTGAWHGGVPQPWEGHSAPGDAGDRRPQPRPPRTCDHHGDQYRVGAARSGL